MAVHTDDVNNMVDILIAAGTVVVALCAALALFRIEARQHRTSLLKPASYKFDLVGMVVYLVMYGVLTIIEKVCFMIGKTPKLDPDDDLYFDPVFRHTTRMNIYNRDEYRRDEYHRHK